MSFIEYKIINDKYFLCTYRTNDRNIIISEHTAEEKFKVLKRSNFKCNTFYDGDNLVIRFYGFGIDDFYNRNFRRKNIKRKVSRVNKFVSYALCVSVIAGSYAGYNFWKTNKNEVDDINSESVDFDYNFVIDVPTVSDEILIENNNTFVDYEKEVEDLYFEEEQLLPEITIEPDSYFDFKYDDRSGSEKTKKTKELYYDVIDKYSKMYGLPTNLMVAVATQESGVHNTSISSGGGFGLFQIQAKGNWNWLGKEVSAYNFNEEKMEKIKVCLDNNNCIDINMLANLEYNTKVACMIMSYNLKLCNYDIIQAIQIYNSGTGVINLEKKYGEDWINHRENLPGDTKYLEHVLSYIDPNDNILEFYDNSNNSHTVCVNNIYELSLKR